MPTFHRIALALVISTLAACGGGGGGGSDPSVTPTPTANPSPTPAPTAPPAAVTTLNLTTGGETVSTTATSVAGPAGATIAVTNPGDPLVGLKIEVPANATDEPITFRISSSPVDSSSGIPADTAIQSRRIRIEATGSDDWNTLGMFNRAVKVTLPYEGNDDVAFYVVNQDGTVEPTGFAARDTANNRITFWTRTFANSADGTDVSSGRKLAIVSSVQYQYYVALGVSQQTWADWSGLGATIDTGFRSANNGWYIPNYGSFYAKSRGGNCFGMVGWAKYYFKSGYSPVLHSNYRDPAPTTTWLDDDVAIELASRVHNGMSDIWNQFLSDELDLQVASSESVAHSLVGALYATGAPALIAIYQYANNELTGGHAIMTYRADIDDSGNITFHVYDPNFPGDDTRRIRYINGTGFQNYLSGTTAGDSRFAYNYFQHVGYHVGLSDAVLAQQKSAADNSYTNGSVFPTITITSITGLANGENVLENEGKTAEGQDKVITSDNAVKIEGTVLGGKAQTAGSVVNNIRILTPSGNYSAAVDNQAGSGTGEFKVAIPLKHGENQIAFLAAKYGTLSHWAAFEQQIIESTATAAAMTVTLTWGQNNSDVDLYVKEPDGNGHTGDLVYYSNRASASPSYPYLDFDNTSGYGPEHYVAKDGMVTRYADGTTATSLYGDYTIGVHYFSDDDDNYEEDQRIGWSVGWRYLAFCADPCDDPEMEGFWVEGSTGGTLTTADSNQDGPGGFAAQGSAWSGAWTISYPEPDPRDYEVPPSNEIMLP